MKIKTKSIIMFASFLLLAFFVFANQTQAASTDIVITEIMYNPTGSDSKTEWLEIYNKGSSPVVIVEGSGADSWRFNDGANHILTLVQSSLTIPAGGFAILASDGQTFLDNHQGFSGTVIDTVMSLNNTSDTIKLSADKGESFFSQISYQNSWGGDGDGNTLEKIDLTGNDSQSNWQASFVEAGTPGAVSSAGQEQPGSQPSEDNQGPELPPASAPSPTTDAPDSNKLKITEVFPNPSGDETSLEFIELWNNQAVAISLTGWKLADLAKVITLPEVTLVPGEYYAFYRSATKIALNNTNETIKLFSPSGDLIDEFSYTATWEDQSLGYDINQDKFIWSALPTPSAANQIIIPNDPPEAIIDVSNNPVAPNELITISGLESSDPDDDLLSFFWTITPATPKAACDFCADTTFQASGAIFNYRFSGLGSYIVSLTVADRRNQTQAKTTIDVLPAQDILDLRRRLDTPLPPHPNPLLGQERENETQGQLYITEIFPNPAGRDDNEWIEIYNPNNFAVNLAGWIIDDQEGGSRPHTITDRLIKANSYLVLGKDETRIILNNTSDEVRLFDADDNLIDSVLYDDVVEAQSFSRSDDGLWFWAADITPGLAPLPEGGLRGEGEGLVFNPPPIPLPSQREGEYPVDIDLANIRELEPGTEVRVQGQVAVEPRVLGKTYFYIVGSRGIQIYFSRQDWPVLALGDMVGVVGEISEAGGEKRIKLANKQDLVFLYQSDPPIPLEIQSGQTGEENEGSLVKIAAELLEKKGNSWYLDDGSGEARIVFQSSANIAKPIAKPGDWLEITGLVSQTQAGYRLLPRSSSDLRLLSEEEIAPQVLGEQIAADDIQRFRIPPNNRPNQIFIYLLITSITLIIILTGLFIKLHSKTKKALRELENKKGRT